MKLPINKKSLFTLLAFTLLLIGAYFIHTLSKWSKHTEVYSHTTLLVSSWEKYKEGYITLEGRVIDHSQNGITTSEGQSYAMLRAVWIDDKPTFDTTWQWTKENLKRPDDNLLGWKWGQKTDGSYGFIENGGDNSASDADVDTALALILASRRWNIPDYQQQALPIIKDIWEVETATASGQQYLTAGNWAEEKNRLVLNPSYFNPAAYRIFATVDTAHDWNSLVNPAYQLLTNSGQVGLDKEKGVGLPPDWVAIDKKTGQLGVVNLPSLTTNYSYDALRIPWRIAVDYLWNNDPQSIEYLRSSFQFLSDRYQSDHKLLGGFTHDGKPLNNKEDYSLYGASLGYFKLVAPEVAADIYQNKIIDLYSNDSNTFSPQITYYPQNWLWLGAALEDNFIIPFNKN